MKMIKIILTSLLLVSQTATAGVITGFDFFFNQTSLLGVDDFNVNGTNYEVRFLRGSYNTLYGNGQYSVPFTTFSQATIATTALYNDIFDADDLIIDGNLVANPFNDRPYLTNGCFIKSTCSIFTAYGSVFDTGSVDAIGTTLLLNSEHDSLDNTGLGQSFDVTENISAFGQQVYAVWTASSIPDDSSGGDQGNNSGGSGSGAGGGNNGGSNGNNNGPVDVTEPSTMLLMLLGLALLVSKRRSLNA